jgi:integrase
MAAPVKDGKVWRHRIMVNGARVSGTFDTKAQALEWEAQQRVILKGGPVAVSVIGKTVKDAFDKYEVEVSRHKRSYQNEAKRLAYFRATELAKVKISELRTSHIVDWKTERLKTVKGSTVNRDLNLLSHVFNTARKEWGWLETNVTEDVSRATEPPAREQRYTEKEIKAICAALGWDVAYKGEPQTKQHRVALAFLWALETAMRAGEIVSLTKDSVKGRVAHLPMTKNGLPRNVPLSKRALEIWKQVPDGFGLNSASLDALFRKAREKARVDGKTFHDARHEAITRLALKIDVLDLARMVGHTDIRQLLRYYNASADDIAGRL